VSHKVIQASLLAQILAHLEMQMMFQMTVIQHQLNGKRMRMKISKKISMMPIMMSLLVMMVLTLSSKIPIMKTRKLMQFMKLLMSIHMKKRREYYREKRWKGEIVKYRQESRPKIQQQFNDLK
jgi:hypothetical protein